MTTESFLPRIGGAEMHVWYLMEQLKKRGHEIVLLTPESQSIESTRTASAFPEPEGVTRIPWKRSNLSAILKFMWRESKNADVLHAHCSYRLGAFLGIVGRLRGKSVIVTLHGQGTLNEKKASFVPRLALSLYRYVSLSTATRVISTSLDLAVVAWKYVPRSRRKTTIVFNGIDTTVFDHKVIVPEKVQDRYVGKKVILTVRRLVPKNGVQFLLEALPYIVAQEPRAMLVLVGGGRLVEHMRKRVMELGLSEFVDILGDKENHRSSGIRKAGGCCGVSFDCGINQYCLC